MDIYVDGSCLDNGGSSPRAGWSFIVTRPNSDITIESKSGKIRSGKQTHNRAELESMYQALFWIKSQDTKEYYIIYHDSEMVVKAIHGETSRITNRDIWCGIESLAEELLGRFTVQHVEAHKINSKETIHRMNCEADKLARRAANSLLIGPITI